ncbi:high-affinity branched-chain amino acid ABC transporter system permease protein LivM [Gottschalkia acidurici 9a]|uniref:High-affinity branched-chain amino acid ABC transporter system permease protein LivM n=1 Tax=Gottschalkia acidurici (strain ATCC 7906 / DSM 604 / BCRC 14475 / CIP 104303 / KCTC 5404 / NCIMB 10678 / 9a) TaxID=1128398 RepID=K0B4G2_GOTA9|nr:branched-chain amino acid ABC transporter permease [Gottschalkia acidurici]AFS79411.1 high-affinity branched-chain amino acid ABC transporter system permease protein LivM [Gottschalkia acidurici 9a]
MENLVGVLIRITIYAVILFIGIKIMSKFFDWGTAKYTGLNKKSRKTLGIIFGVALLLWPIITSGNPYFLRTSIIVLLYVVLALSLNLILGFAGQLSMGHVAFYAIGAYTTALLTVSFNVPISIAFIASAIMAGIFGLLIGIPILRLKGDYLAIATIGFAEILRLVLINWTSFTKGPAGIPSVPYPSIFGIVIKHNIGYFYIILIMAAITVFISSRLLNSRLGRGLVAIKDDEIAAEAMGIDPSHLKILVFVLGAAIAGTAGSFFASFIHYVNPDNFVYMESVTILTMVVLGGVGSIPGVIVGAAILAILPEALRDISSYRYAIYGLLLVMMMITRPQGMISSDSLKKGGKK